MSEAGVERLASDSVLWAAGEFDYVGSVTGILSSFWMLCEALFVLTLGTAQRCPAFGPRTFTAALDDFEFSKRERLRRLLPHRQTLVVSRGLLCCRPDYIAAGLSAQ